MNSIEISTRLKNGSFLDYHFQIPENWEEVTDEQLPSLIKMAVKPMDEIQKITEVLKVYGFKKRVIKRLILSELREIMKLFSWLNEEWNDHRSLVPKLWVFWGPKDYFSGLQLNQLLLSGLHCQNADKFLEENNQKELKKELRALAATLYTPFGMKYSHKLSKIYEQLFRLVPFWKLRAISISFRSQRLWLKEHFPLCHESSSDEDSRDFGPYGLIVDLAGAEFGDIEQVEERDIFFIFTKLEKLATQNKKNKKK